MSKDHFSDGEFLLGHTTVIVLCNQHCTIQREADANVNVHVMQVKHNLYVAAADSVIIHNLKVT